MEARVRKGFSEEGIIVVVPVHGWATLWGWHLQKSIF